MSVDVGEMEGAPASPFTKRNLLIGAIVIGGGIGLIMFLSRRAAVPAENQAQTGAPKAGALDIAYQNLATQLLGFRGDMTVAQAGLQDAITASTQASITGNTDILGAIGDESTARALSDRTLWGMLTAQFSRQDQTNAWQYALGQANAAISSGLDPGIALGELSTVNQQIAQTTDPYQLGQISSNQSAFYTSQRGAGGATLRDAILATFDGGLGDASDGLRRLSAGPVRVVNPDRRN